MSHPLFVSTRADRLSTGLNSLTPVQCIDIHEASLKVLEKTGVVVEDEETRKIFLDSGCHVDSEEKRVKIPSAITEAAIESAPEKVLLHGRTPENDILLDSQTHVGHFGIFSSNINIVDLESGKIRSSTKHDLVQIARLCDALENLTIFSRAVYPLDVSPSFMHLHTAEACLKNTTMHSIHGPESARETEQIIRMAKAVSQGVGDAENPSTARRPLSFVSSTISPLKMSRDFCEVVKTSAHHGYTTIIASAAMGGGTAPIHLAGLLVQTNAEILSGIVLTQLINKGTPVIYACYSTGMDLKLATSPLGSPEAAMVTSAAAQLCKYYKIPCQVPGLATDSRQGGIQAAFEKTLTGFSTAMSGANIILGAGGLETGLTFDPALAVLDDEMIQMIRHFKKGVPVSHETLSTDIIHEGAHAGSFITHPSTYEHMRSMSQTDLFSRQSREKWIKQGKPKSYAMALDKANDILEKHRPERLPVAVENKLDQILEEAEHG